MITQPVGGGKANQYFFTRRYFLRGFNLDHGTDFAVFLDEKEGRRIQDCVR
jgi:hypothetical protein